MGFHKKVPGIWQQFSSNHHSHWSCECIEADVIVLALTGGFGDEDPLKARMKEHLQQTMLSADRLLCTWLSIAMLYCVCVCVMVFVLCF